MKLPRFDIEDAAEAELSAAAEYLEARRPTAGDRLLEAFDATLEQIAAFPDAWPRLSDIHRRCLVRGFPYWVVYESTPECVRIIAVIHEARRPGYWRGRVGADDR